MLKSTKMGKNKAGSVVKAEINRVKEEIKQFENNRKRENNKK